MLRTRHRASQAGAALLVLLGLACVAVSVIAVMAGQPGGWGFLLIGLPLLILGVARLRGVDAAVRLAGFLAILACGVFLIFISTTSLRGLTPAPGEPAPSIEPVTMVLGLLFIAAAVLLVVGVPSKKS